MTLHIYVFIAIISPYLYLQLLCRERYWGVSIHVLAMLSSTVAYWMVSIIYLYA